MFFSSVANKNSKKYIIIIKIFSNSFNNHQRWRNVSARKKKHFPISNSGMVRRKKKVSYPLSKQCKNIELKLLRICAGFYIRATQSYLRGCLLSGCLDEFLINHNTVSSIFPYTSPQQQHV